MNNLPTLSIADIARPTHISHPMHDDNRRYHRCFMHLYNLCTTEEARQSLRDFQKWWEERRLREYGGSAVSGIGVALSTGGGYGAGGSGGYGAGPAPAVGAGSMKSTTSSGKVKEKKGVFERMGLRRKSGL